MAMTTEDLTRYLQQNTVTLGWASVTVIELEAAATRLSELFRLRPMSHLAFKPFDIPAFDTSPNETVRLKDVRLGTPRLRPAVDTSGALPAGEMVLFIPLVGGVYSVTAVANSVEYLYEHIVLAEPLGYGLSVRLPLAAVKGRVTEGRVHWQWSFDDIKAVEGNLGTVPATCQKIADKLLPYARKMGLLSSPVYTHSLPEGVEGPLSPVSVFMSVTPSGEGDDVYALNLFASTTLQPQEGSLPGPSSPFLLPKKAAGQGYEANIGVYAKSVLSPFLEHRAPGATDALLSLITYAPLFDLASSKEVEQALDKAYWAQLPTLEAQPETGQPRLAPAIATRLLGSAADPAADHEATLVAAAPITFRACGLGSPLTWNLSVWAAERQAPHPEPIAELIPSVTGTSATLQLAQDVTSGHFQLRIQARDARGETALADLILRPASPSARVAPPLASLNADGQAFFEVFSILPNLQVLGGEAQGQAELTEEGFVFSAADAAEEGAAVVLADSARSMPDQALAPSTRYGLGVVDLTPPARTRSRWTELDMFELEASQGDRVYANGRQQLEVTITVGTKAVNGRYVPLSQAEMNSLQLFIKDTSISPIEFLPPGEEEIRAEMGLNYAQTLKHNGAYRFYPGGAATLTDPSADDGKTTARLYLMTRTAGKLTLIARFTSDTGEVFSSNVVDADKGEISVRGVAPPTFTAGTYRFQPEVVGSPFPGTCVVNGSDVGNCLRSVTYWKLAYQDSSVTQVPFVRLMFDKNPPGDAESQLFPTQSLMRWESDRMAEVMFSYTGYAFAPRRVDGGKESAFDPATMYYDPLLEWFMDHRDPASLDHGVKTAAGTPTRVDAGQLWIGLFRTDSTLYWSDIDSETDEDKALRRHPFATFSAHMDGVGLNVNLIDQDGNLHPLSIQFNGAKGVGGHRDALRVEVRGLSDK
ncbi:hypothetical protein [Pseudomonas massiliensis]|uniref:hypothetical protein n=1 Tax=Pseudomonas massiliensis TaxID=522492 RepID=UPI00059121D6|nr:hypothetical protein [Pseudomonas massiliensis]